MKDLLRKIILRLLYLTPFGYILRLINLINNADQSGVVVLLQKNEPVAAYVKKDPTARERFNWFINGISLFFQVGIAFYYDFKWDWAGAYAWVAFLFGSVNIISALFPTVDWNKKISFLFFSKLEWFVILSMVILGLFISMRYW